MKLKDFKSDPKKYDQIKLICAQRRIPVTDEMDVNDILAANNTLEARSRRIGFAIGKARSAVNENAPGTGQVKQDPKPAAASGVDNQSQIQRMKGSAMAICRQFDDKRRAVHA